MAVIDAWLSKYLASIPKVFTWSSSLPCMNTILLFLVTPPDDKINLAKRICSLSVCDTSPPCGVCCLDSRAQGCSFHFLLDAHHGSVQLLCWTSGISEIFFCPSVFVLGLMSKPMLVTLPFVLLLLDYWPLQRLLKSNQPMPNTNGHWSILSFGEKVPLFALAILSSIVTYVAQGGAVKSLKRIQ